MGLLPYNIGGANEHSGGGGGAAKAHSTPVEF